MITVERINGMTRITFPHDEVPIDRLNRFLDWLRAQRFDRVTAVDPLPPTDLERIYSQPDEFTGVTAEQLAAAQVQEEPQLVGRTKEQ